MCLLWGADLRLWHSWWMSTIQDARKTWLATVILFSLVEDAVSGVKIAGATSLYSRECARLWFRVFCGKVLFFGMVWSALSR